MINPSMNIREAFKFLSIAITVLLLNSNKAQAQSTETVTNTDNENVEVNVQESGSQQQGQSSNGNTSSVSVTDEAEDDNFWSSSYRGRLSIPPGSASLTCGDQVVAFSRSGGFGLGVGAAGINFSDNQGQLPEEFKANLTAIQQCAKGKNTAEILQKYVELAKADQAIADTYLRTVSPEIYATFFVENAKDKSVLLSEQSFSKLATDIRNQEFNRVVEWQDNFYSAGLAKQRVEFTESQKLQTIKRKKRLAELEILELERKAREVEAIIRARQSKLDGYLQQYQQK